MNNDEDVDALLAGDLPGNGRKKKQIQKKKVRLNYSSDSDEEVEDEETGNHESKEEEPVEKEDHSDDMFADSDNEQESGKEEVQSRKPATNKSDRMDMDQFEKEEGIEDYKLEEEEHIEDEEDEESNEEKMQYFTRTEEAELLPDSVQSKKAKWNPKIEAFNLREEAEEGHFDLDGNFVRNTKNGAADDDDNDDERAKHEDHWMSSTKKADIVRARNSQLQREKIAKNKILERSRSALSTEKLLAKLIEILEPAESPLEALARLAPQKGHRHRKRKQPQEVNNPNKELILSITEVCDQLENDKSVVNVYEMSREELMRLYKTECGEDYKSSVSKRSRAEFEDDLGNETNTSAEENDFGDKVWQFRWLESPNEILGPYSTYEMKYWKESYFEDKVEVKRVDGLEFQHVGSVEFDD